MYGNDDFLNDLQSQRQRYTKFHVGRALCVPLDAISNILFKVGSDYKSTPVKAIALELIPGTVGLVLLQSAAPVIGTAAIGSGMLLGITPLGRIARRALTSCAPASSTNRASEKKIQEIIPAPSAN
jgi:hypothetical protein